MDSPVEPAGDVREGTTAGCALPNASFAGLTGEPIGHA
ncbi:MAG: hypothetical protein KatS3mg119_0331 [Rhodothalassiaceae bacterium]|nr:MAG: hypothetical protein KatS3mg119_0331 [Rhodothalassiaceae bacterium]